MYSEQCTVYSVAALQHAECRVQSAECCGVTWSNVLLCHPERGEEPRDDLRGESGGSQPIDTMIDDREARNGFRSIEGSYICRHHVEPGVELCVLKEESFPIPLHLFC